MAAAPSFDQFFTTLRNRVVAFAAETRSNPRTFLLGYFAVVPILTALGVGLSAGTGGLAALQAKSKTRKKLSLGEALGTFGQGAVKSAMRSPTVKAKLAKLTKR